MAFSTRRTTLAPGSTTTSTSQAAASGSSSTNSNANPSALSMQRNRQYSHLAAQLATLNANLADTENLLRMTACQAEVVRGLGAWMGGLFMAASKVLGEEGVVGSGAAAGASVDTVTGAIADADSNGGRHGGGDSP